jgi:hypothetical protein
MINLFFIESPLQLLNAYEAINSFNITKYKIVIRLSGEKLNDIQIKNIINHLDIKNVTYISINTKNRTIFDYIKIMMSTVRYLFTNVDNVFIGNYDSRFLNLIMKQFNRKKIILLDDGSKTISIQNKFVEKNKYYDMFTMYDIEPILNQHIYKNDYNSIRSLCQSREKNNQDILFLGMKLSEIGIITEEYYLKLISKISRYYKDKNIIYIPHRGESNSKISLVKNYKNIVIKYIEYPVELYGLYEDTIPGKVVSFYSTALLTIKNIYKIEAECLNFNYSKSMYKDDIDSIYNYYIDYLKVLDTDEFI